jgi:hypothetical protein
MTRILPEGPANSKGDRCQMIDNRLREIAVQTVDSCLARAHKSRRSAPPTGALPGRRFQAVRSRKRTASTNAVFFIALFADCLQLIAYRRPARSGQRATEKSGAIIYLISTLSLWITSKQGSLKSFPRSVVTTAGMVLEKKAVRFASRRKCSSTSLANLFHSATLHRPGPDGSLSIGSRFPS